LFQPISQGEPILELTTIIAELKSKREKIGWAIAAPVPQNLIRPAASHLGDLLRLPTRGLDFDKRPRFGLTVDLPWLESW
ncbi:MAG: hypothetical protein ACLP0B_22520, partial [Steroidobacteraceae bacterium]